MMGSCSGLSSSLHRSRYVSWCLDSPAVTATAPEETSPQNHQPAGPGSVPLLPLSPPKSSGGETNATFCHQRLQSTHHKAFTHPRPSAVHSISKALHHHHHHQDNDGEEEGSRNKEDQFLLHPEGKTFLLPRSSPVISRRHGGRNGSSEPPSSDSLSAAPGSLSLDQRRCPVTSKEDLGSKPSPSHFLSLAFSGQHEGLTSCDGPHSSAQHSKESQFSGVPELSADIFKTTCELEKENAHFIVVDMMLEVLEGVKWTLSSERWASLCDMCANEHEQRCKQERHRNTQRRSEDEEEEEAGNDEAEHLPKTSSILSTDSGFQDCGVVSTLTLSAECLARLLVLEFRRSWLPSYEPRHGRQSLRSSLQELPGSAGAVVSSSSSSSLAEEIRLRTRMRGSLSWAPPRCQIIFTVQPTHRRSEVVALQHFLCAGCGTKVEPRYIKKLRYCEYFGRYFCDCCHSGSEAVIPGRILTCWDFGRYPVSDFSKQLLDSVWHQPLFDLTCVGKTLYSRVKELDRFRELQEQLMDIKKLLAACRLSRRVVAEFEQFPAHLMEQPLLFSMDDLLKVKKGHLVSQARSLLHSAVDHVENCELCLARGFFCEFCREKDVIFPFQRDICRRCPVCRACFHKHCFVEKKCPKCARIQSRKNHRDGSVK